MKLVEEVTGQFSLTETRQYNEVKKGFTAFQDGDVIFAKVTPCMENGKMAVVKGLKNGIGFGSTEFHVFRCNEELDHHYLFFFLVQRQFRYEAEGSMTGAVGLRRVPKFFLEEHPIPLPPLPVQQAIVAKIEELFSELDAGVKELQTALARLKTYRQAVLHHYLNNPDWERVKLSSITHIITDGDHQAPPKADSGVPFIVISNIKNNQINFSQTKFVPEEYYNSIKDSRKPKSGDILYTVTGSYGIPVLLETEQKFCFQRHIGLIKPDEKKVVRKYLLYVLKSKDVYNQATSVATGTAQLTVPLSGLRNFKIPLPDLITQAQIVSEIEARLSEADAMETTIRQELARAENLRQSILKQAFAGKLVTAASGETGTEELVKVAEPISPVYSGQKAGQLGEQLSLF